MSAVSEQALLAASEVNCREGNGLRVRLLWLSDSDGLLVEVEDFKSGSTSYRRTTAEMASEVFNHPFAYAAVPLISETDSEAFTEQPWLPILQPSHRQRPSALAERVG